MFSYFGSKYRLAKRYGKPKHGTVIEPFAGSACYSLFHDAPKAILIEANPIVAGIWQFLISATEKEILSLPTEFESVSDLNIPQEAKWLIGFWLGKGRVTPVKTQSVWTKQYQHFNDCKVWGTSAKKRIASQLSGIRDWQVINADYSTAPDVEATWFIDPPYSKSGHLYAYHELEKEKLKQFCDERRGQLIVCEDETASWLPFVPLAVVRGVKKLSREVLYARG